jgi:glutaredoxin
VSAPGRPVLLYTRPGCPFCDAKRAELAARGVAVREIDLAAAPQAIPELLKLTGGRRVVPVLVEDGRVLVAPEGGSEF